MRILLFLCSLALAVPASAADFEDRVSVNPDSDAKAIELAQSVMKNMGGWKAWDNTRYLNWKFFGNRHHWWDKQTNNIRVETKGTVILMNLDTMKGRAWEDGEEITHPDSLALRMERGSKMWVNDSYWMFMPYKLLDPGVTIRYGGTLKMEDGRDADVLNMTFGEGIGYTPQNRYEIFIAKDTGLVEQWNFYTNYSDTEARFKGPWTGWKQFGNIKLATSRGRDIDWEIGVHETVPEGLFTNP
ncbi:MAG: hypothetical protein HKN21_00950 [Candidatus Eisenbacteria bacterium]|uniref:Uncharacterized protein n=1 Tax=Eiseniibacteriota bacterium TaxID=2212470 RepID=A0A7Y2H147_UNCEI|nr:hypothetical protein [Candidatus Eisenbacteria bacterium]